MNMIGCLTVLLIFGVGVAIGKLYGGESLDTGLIYAFLVFGGYILGVWWTTSSQLREEKKMRAEEKPV